MSDPMSPEELRACRERAEAATPGPLLAEPDGDGGYSTFTPHGLRQSAEAHTAFIAHARTDVPRLLATIDAAQRETASHRHAALLAAGIHGGPGAWRWASDPSGTALDDVAAWERLLGEMRDLGSVEALRKLRWSVVANAGRLSLRGPAPRWAHVMSTAGLGSTSAKDLCIAAGFDPDEEVGSWPEPCETCAEEEEDEEAEDE